MFKNWYAALKQTKAIHDFDNKLNHYIKPSMAYYILSSVETRFIFPKKRKKTIIPMSSYEYDAPDVKCHAMHLNKSAAYYTKKHMHRI
uniref:Uncharacterized protein n=1 Tax=Arundo donax TaxID=35708 RepID=A0A0A9DPE8_ARUDO